jgi:hypothetical protein
VAVAKPATAPTPAAKPRKSRFFMSMEFFPEFVPARMCPAQGQPTEKIPSQVQENGASRTRMAVLRPLVPSPLRHFDKKLQARITV